MNSINTQGGFNLPNKIDDSMNPEPEPEAEPNEDEFDFSSHNPQMMYPPPPPSQPFFQFSPPSVEKPSSFFDGDNKMYFIILFIAFILGFFMGKTMQPIIIRST